MKLCRRQFLHLALGPATVPAVSRISSAGTYPSRPVRIIVGFSAGGGADIVGRLLVVRAPADGYTLLLVTPVSGRRPKS
jgi:tripartite-type tricarboxylate transporter receptor subunit TctC